MTVAPKPCPDENSLAEFVEGKATATLKARIEVHLDQCAQCTELLAVMATSYRSSEPEAVVVEAPLAPHDRSHIAAVSLPDRSAPLVLLLLFVHGVSLAWLLQLWLGQLSRLDATARVTALGYLTILQLCNSLAASAVVAAAAITPLQRRREPLAAALVLSWWHPALFVLVSLCAHQGLLGTPRVQRQKRWLAGGACILYSCCLAAICGLWWTGISLPLAPELATGLLLLGLLSGILVLARRAGSDSSATAGDSPGRAGDILFGVCSVATGVGALLGLTVLRLRLRGAS